MPPNQPADPSNSTMPNDDATFSNRLQAEARLSPMGKRLFKFIEFDKDEQLLLEVKKHPVGLLWISILGLGISLIVMIVSAVFASAVGSGLLDGGGVTASNLRTIILLVGLVVSLLGILFTFILASLYVRDVIFITDQKIAEVVYVSLFNRRTIQLNIGKVEDVAVTQVGIFPRIFKYGSLLIETAGETKNPEFPYVPEPYMVSQVIIQAHEDYVRKYGN